MNSASLHLTTPIQIDTETYYSWECKKCKEQELANGLSTLAHCGRCREQHYLCFEHKINSSLAYVLDKSGKIKVEIIHKDLK